jgi:hypothetical protein
VAVRIERKVSLMFLVGSIALLGSGILLIIWPPHGDDAIMRLTASMAPILGMVSIVIGAGGTWRLILLAMQRTPMIAADASGISIEGGRPIGWDHVLSIEPFEWKQRITIRGILIKLRDRKGLVANQLGSWWTRAAAARTPGDIFINDATIKLPLLNAIAQLHAERPQT